MNKPNDLLHKFALLELAVEHWDIVQAERAEEKVENSIMELLDDDEVAVRMAAGEALVKLAEEGKVKRSKLFNKILNEVPESGSILMILMRLAEKDDEKKIISDKAKKIDIANLSYIFDELNLIAKSFKTDKQDSIKKLLQANSPAGNNRVFNNYMDIIRPQILEYLAKEIDGRDTKEFKSIIDAIIKNLDEEKYNIEVKEFLKKIYKKADDPAKKIIRGKIESLDPDVKMAVLADEDLLPVESEFLGNAEYIDRLFKSALPKEIEKKLTGYDTGGLKLSRGDIGRLLDFAPEELIEKIDERIEEVKTSLKSGKDDKGLNEKKTALEQIKQDISDMMASQAGIEIDSINYAKAVKEFEAAVESKDAIKTIKIREALSRLKAQINAADSLEFVELLQRLYLYLLNINGNWEMLGENYRISELTGMIKTRLEKLRQETLENLGAVLDKADESGKKELEEYKEKIEKADFLQPLRTFTGNKKRRFLKYGKNEKKIDKISGKEAGSKTGQGVDGIWTWLREPMVNLMEKGLSKVLAGRSPPKRETLERFYDRAIACWLENGLSFIAGGAAVTALYFFGSTFSLPGLDFAYLASQPIFWIVHGIKDSQGNRVSRLNLAPAGLIAGINIAVYFLVPASLPIIFLLSIASHALVNNLIAPRLEKYLEPLMDRWLKAGKKEDYYAASELLWEIIPSKIQAEPNTYILKDRSWLFKQWPRLRLGLIGMLTAWPGSGRLPIDTAKHVKHDLERRVLGSLPPNEPALLDILKAKSIEIRRLPENISWGKYLTGLVRQEWMEREGAQIKIFLPAQLCDEYKQTPGQADAMPGRLVSQIMAYLGERHYSGIYTNIHQAEGLLKTVESDPLLAQQFNLQTPAGRSLQNALEQLARGETPAAVQRLSRVVLRALTKAENQALEKRLLSMLEQLAPRESIKVEIRFGSEEKYQMRLPAIIFEKKSLYWRLNLKYPGGIIIEKNIKLPVFDLLKSIYQAT